MISRSAALLPALALTLVAAAQPARAQDDAGVRGTIAASYNSHFFSYGSDVWGAGDDLFGKQSTTFLSGDLVVPVNAATRLNFGVRADVNDNGTNPVTGDIQEVDAYIGASTDVGPATVGATYQQWFYLDDIEKVVDVRATYNEALWGVRLYPSLLWHARVEGTGFQKEGSVLVASIAPSLPIGDSGAYVTFPVGAGFFLTEGYRYGTKTGYAYGYAGASFGIPLPKIPSVPGTTSINLGVTYYTTEPDAVPFNVKSDFVGASVGLSQAF